MSQKLNLKIHGINDQNDLDLIAGNLKAQNGIKQVRFSLANNCAEMSVESDHQSISKQQIFDIINLGGDFRVEEVSAISPVSPVERREKISSPVVARGMTEDIVFGLNVERRYLVSGLALGALVISLLLNVVLIFFARK